MLNRPQLLEAEAVALEQIVIDFAHAAGDRAQLGLVHAGLIGQFGDGEPLADQLAGAENVEAILKNRVDLRQAELGNRSDFGQPWQPADDLFDRVGDLHLDLFGRECRHQRVDLHHHRTGVGKGVDRQAGQREHPRNDQRSGQQQHDGPMFEAETDDAIEQLGRESFLKIRFLLTVRPVAFENPVVPAGSLSCWSKTIPGPFNVIRPGRVCLFPDRCARENCRSSRPFRPAPRPTALPRCDRA